MSALFAFILDSFVFWRLRGIVRERASSTSITSESVNQERNEKYEHRLARQMLLYPACVQLNDSAKMADMGLADCIHDFDRSTYSLPLHRVGRP
jgi:hypothetical protein